MIYYSHVNEDNRIERRLLQSSGCNTVVAVAGSGERVISLLDYKGCRHFYAVDVNEEALFLLELKLTALKNFPVDDYLAFCGYRAAGGESRLAQFENIKRVLSAKARSFWQSHPAAIKTGIGYAGHFEKFLQRIRPFIRFFLGKKFMPVFSENAAEHRQFPEKRWRLLMHLFAKRWVYRFWGNKDIAFISKDADTARIPAALNEVMYNTEAPSCFMAHLVFKGHLQDMPEAWLPPSLQQHVLKNVKQRLMDSSVHIHYHHVDILKFAAAFKGAGVFYSLSDILSFSDTAYLQQLVDTTTATGNQVVWRSFLRNRVYKKDKAPVASVDAGIKEYSSEESTRMYQVFAIETASLP